MTTRRDFLRALALGTGAILVPQYGRWHRQGSGVLTPEWGIVNMDAHEWSQWVDFGRISVRSKTDWNTLATVWQWGNGSITAMPPLLVSP